MIFDFDGTLSVRQEGAYGIYADYFRKYFSDMSDLEFEAVLQDFLLYECNGTISMKKRIENYRRKYGTYLPEDLEEDFLPYYHAHMYEYTVLRDGMKEVLEQLKGRYRLGDPFQRRFLFPAFQDQKGRDRNLFRCDRRQR